MDFLERFQNLIRYSLHGAMDKQYNKILLPKSRDVVVKEQSRTIQKIAASIVIKIITETTVTERQINVNRVYLKLIPLQ